VATSARKEQRSGKTRSQLRSLVAATEHGRMSTSPDAKPLDEDLRATLESARSTFHALVDALSEEDLRRRSNNPGWTNGQVLFHMAFGFILLPSLVRIIRFWALFPRSFSRPFAAVLDASTPVFNWVNGLGPRGGARIYRGKALARKYDRTHARIPRILGSTRPQDMALGMHYPRRWDPLFDGYITLERLFRYPAAHLQSHVGELRRRDS
jgi:DinB superfamily